MQKRAPTLGNIFVIILFALSCFGLLLFLWESFGGPAAAEAEGLPLHRRRSRARWRSPNSPTCASAASTSATSSSLKLDNDGRTDATIEIGGQYAPIRANTHAILRQKTLLGETYVQLIPQGPDGPVSCPTTASSPTPTSNRR